MDIVDVLKKYGINSEAELDEAIKKMSKANLGVFKGGHHDTDNGH